ncbi:hypothetical protein ACIRP7_27175 [Streptomyces sp. NPDC102270]|uniref:hypothetical protein n=1 Tax=Streptomyces sp. NPDC102270 TaxID=3366150 RepID=UPI00380B51BC
MSLYNHVPNKEALLAGVTEALLDRIDFAAAAAADTWQDRVRAHAAAFRATARQRPKAFPLVRTRPSQSPALLRPVRSALTGFAEPGLEPRALHGVRRRFDHARAGLFAHRGHDGPRTGAATRRRDHRAGRL